jgi:ABC-2 type transport system ATP-binding protein
MHVTIKQLQKQYGNQLVLDIPDLHIEEGELVGIAGNNGAGKTTLFRLLLDLIPATHGFCTIGDEQVHESTSWKSNTGSFLDEGFLIGFLTPEEYMLFNASTYGIDEEQALVKLSEYKSFMQDEVLGTGKYIRQLSTGNKQKVGIAAAMISEPKLLILDEPFNFLDPSSQITIRNLLKKKNRERKTTMFISSHNINHLAEICSRIILLEKGKIIRNISIDEGFDEIGSYFAENA